MSAALIAAVAALVGSGVYLITSRSLSRIVLGFSLLGHSAVLALLVSRSTADRRQLRPGTI
jgi:multicomponent Na+:H+ antiporter subunit C